MKILSSSPLKNAHWPWPKINIEEVSLRALDNDLIVPNIGFINISDIQSWVADTTGASNSKKLWLNSLLSSHACLEYSGNEKGVLAQGYKLLSSYFSQFDSNRELFDIAWKDEHAVSNRLFVICAFILRSMEADANHISQVELLYQAERHANWLSNEENYVENNHGVMMDLSLAQFGVLIRDVDPELSDRYTTLAILRLKRMLTDTFDSDGCCTENSPAYHFVNYSLFKSIMGFLKEYCGESSLLEWEETLKKAQSVGEILLKKDGKVPLIGDSEAKLGTFFSAQESNDCKIGYYPEAGLLVHSDEHLYFTLRAGGKKFTHRHIDDLSITVWYSGFDFIVDSGLYNYDSGDKLRRAFISSYSHSGFYLESQGHVLYKNFTSPSDMSRFIKFDRRTGDDFSVTASHSLSKDADVFRTLHFQNGNILIRDNFESDTLQNWRFQLVLHPLVEVELDLEKYSITLKRGDVVLNITYAVLDSESEALIESGHYSERFMEYQKTRVLVIKGSSRKVNLSVDICAP